MSKNNLIGFITLFLWAQAQTVLADSRVRIQNLSGEVKVRRGVEEAWHPVSAGTQLEDIDSILTGEAGEVVLELPGGSTFRLGSHAILDVADLRKITEKELFLLLMSRKIQKIERHPDKTKLRIGRVNVVHGELKQGSQTTEASGTDMIWQFERNGALALYRQNYTTNSILKLNDILAKYPDVPDCGELQFHLGRAFEKLGKPGQALDAYKAVRERDRAEACQRPNLWKEKAEQAISRLSQ